MNQKQLLRIPALSALLCIFVVLTPPFFIAGIPLSLQPFIIALFAFLFDWKTTLSIVALYILVGFLGFPVFSGGKNGLLALTSGTIGFIIGFFPYALILSLSNTMTNSKSLASRLCLMILASITALITLYVFGYIFKILTTPQDVKTFTTLMTPFFLLDLLKLSIALGMSLMIRPLLSTHLE